MTWMDLDAAAARLGVSRRTLERQNKAGVLPTKAGPDGLLVWARPLGLEAELAELRDTVSQLADTVSQLGDRLSRPADTVSPSSADSSCKAILEQLDRIKGTTSDKAVERAARMPAGFLSLARKGGRRSARATPSWVKLGLWIKGEQPQLEPEARAAAIRADIQRLYDHTQGAHGTPDPRCDECSAA